MTTCYTAIVLVAAWFLHSGLSFMPMQAKENSRHIQKSNILHDLNKRETEAFLSIMENDTSTTRETLERIEAIIAASTKDYRCQHERSEGI